jgi:hypothetical protein
MLLEDPIDLHAIYTTGAQVTRLKPAIATACLHAAMAETHIPDTFQAGEMKRYESRYGPEWSLDYSKPTPDIWQNLLNGLLQKDFAAIIQRYPGLEDPTMHKLTLHHCQQGYWMSWHEDLASRPVFLVLCYFTPDTLSVDDGGTLELARVTRSSPHTISQRHILHRIAPNQGVVVIADCQTPFFQHQVVPLITEKKRYLAAMSIGSPDW